jgi:hypothetical protein
MTLKQLQNRIDTLDTELARSLGSAEYDMVTEFVELSIELERECNK